MRNDNQPVTAPLNWGKRESPESEASMRARYQTTIAETLERTRGESEIGILLAIGAVCTAISRREREIWLEEVKRLTEGEKE